MENMKEERLESVIENYNEAKLIAKNQLGSEDPAIIAACMSALNKYDIEKSIDDFGDDLQQMKDEQSANMSNVLYTLEKRK